MRILFLIALVLQSTLAFGQMSESAPNIAGATDDTKIGNVSDSLKVYSTQGTSPWVTSRNWTLGFSTDAVTSYQGGTWTVQQGATPTSVGNAWPFKLTDGTNTTAVKAASTAPAATDPAAVVVQSPNGNHATAANQATEITALQLIDNPVGSVAPGTAGTSSYLGGGIYNSSTPTLTNGQQAALQLDSAANLKVTGQGTSQPMINRVDASGTVSSSSSTGSGTLDTNGLNSTTFQMNITAISGSGAYIQIHLQTSEDGSNWSTLVDTPRLTATGFYRYGTFRVSPRYYRYTWDVAGSTPSITFAITTSMKPYDPPKKGQRFFYSDIDLSTLGSQSSVFGSSSCTNVTVVFSRAADGGNNGTVQLFGSIDGVLWESISGNLAANPNTSNYTTLSANSWPNLNLQVTAKTNVGTRTLDIQWSCFQ